MNKIIAIAIDAYQDSQIGDLGNCTNDINALVKILSKKYEFDSIAVYSRPEQTTLPYLYQELHDQLDQATPDDNILILHAGHGHFNGKLETNYWLCSDSKKNGVTTWFNMAALLAFFKASAARHIMLVTDSCFSGAIFETVVVAG